MNCNWNAISIWYNFKGYSDSNGANTSTHRKPQGDNIFIHRKSNAVLWQSWKEGVIAMLILKAELITHSEASSKVKWFLPLK